MLALFLALRGALALVSSRTFFQPDEYWQSLEIAHRIVFGYGYRTWEWTGAPPIRSAVHPALFVPVYWVLRVLRLDGGALLTAAPALWQSALTAAGESFAHTLVRRLGGARVADTWVRCGAHHSRQLVLELGSLYLAYTGARTFSNTAEAALCSVALYYWPLDPARVSAMRVSRRARVRFCQAVAAAFLAVLMRPTSLVLWAFLGARALWDAARTRVLARTLLLAVVSGAPVLVLGAALDSWYYGECTLTLRAFFVENVVHGVSVFYGTHPWHWYLFQGLPVLATASLPWAAAGWWAVLADRGVGPFARGRSAAGGPPPSTPAKRDTGDTPPSPPRDSAPLVEERAATHTLALACVWTVAVYSLLSHKEFRFLQVLVPWLHFFAALALARGAPAVRGIRGAFAALPPLLRWLLVAQVPVAVYAVAFHAQAQVQVMAYLRTLRHPEWRMKSAGFLMPCHSTPWQSHLHAPSVEVLDRDAAWTSGEDGHAWFLTCPPPRGSTDAATYWDQSDFFFHDPVRYLAERFPARVDERFPAMRREHFRPPVGGNASDPVAAHAAHDLGWRHAWPSHLVLFESLLRRRSPQCGEERGCGMRAGVSAGADAGADADAACVTVGQFLKEKGYVERKRLWNAIAHPDVERRGHVVVLQYVPRLRYE
ncbi:glycosylphosphatidylinositol anchor biosynthesis [Malassezia sp. CBS 17886]|nr:glycosylphosphatidylinositol anchor biosynthesis [Malassezia sp. CBS 17886]